MLTLNFPYSDQIRAGVFLNGNTFWSNTNVQTSLGLGLHSPYRDLFGEDLARTVIPLRYVSLRYLMGLQTSDDPTPTYPARGYDPDSTTPEYVRRVQRWSSFLSNLGFLFGNLPSKGSPERERGIHHMNLYGGLNIGSRSLSYIHQGTIPTGVCLDSVTQGSHVDWWGGSPTQTIFEFLESRDLSYYDVVDAGKHTHYYGLSYGYSGDRFLLTYYYRYRMDQNEGYYHHVYKIDWDVSTHYRVNPTSNLYSVRSINDYLEGDITVTFKILQNYFVPSNGDPIQYSQYIGQGGVATMRYYWDIYAGVADWVGDSDILSEIGYNPINESYSDSGLFSFRRFVSIAQGVMPDAYPMAFFSAKNAMDAYLETMTSNHLEFLSDLSSWLSIIDLVAAIAQLRKGVLLPQLIKLLADARLTYSFGIAPTINDAKDVAKKAPEFLERLTHLSEPTIIHGVFSMDIPVEISPLPLSLVTHSKMRIRVSPDSFLTLALPLRSAGLLPSPSTLWDCIPFSFVVDWFTHIGDFTEDAEFSAMMLAVAVEWSTNSALLYHQFSEDFLTDHSANVILGETGSVHTPGAGYRLFSRWPQVGFPALSPSRLLLHAHGDMGIPDWTSFSSLIVQKLKR